MNKKHHSMKETAIAQKTTEMAPVTKATDAKTKLEGSSFSVLQEANENASDVVEELKGTTRKAKRILYAGLYCIVLLTLSGMVYFFFDSPETNDELPLAASSNTVEEGTSHNQSDDWRTSGEDGIVFLPSIDINIENPKRLERTDFALPQHTRSSLSNFDFGAHTFLTDNKAIQQETRIYLKLGNTAFFLQQQRDGNLVVYDEKRHVIWNSGVVQTPNSKRRYRTVLQSDGNLVTYSRINGERSKVEWASNSRSNADDYNLVLTPSGDGLMIVRRNNGQIIWSTVSVHQSHHSPPSSNGRIIYVPGKLVRRENGLLLSEGLRSRIVARTGQRVVLDGRNHERSNERFHEEPDGAAVFADPDTGGWVYVSNSEVKQPRGRGGVGAIYFDKHARTTGYRMIQRGTTANCSGGKTPWNTWVSCEETGNGRVFQIDPFGRRGMQEMTMDRGFFEAFAYDIRDRNHPRFFVTEDKERGPLRRFSPSVKNWNDPWQLLHAPGTIQYLVLEPRGGGRGTFRWTTNKDYAKGNAQRYYPFSEGVDVYRNQLFFTVKERKQLFILDLDRKTFEMQSTRSGVFDGMPDQVQRIVDDGLLYFCEEGGVENGVHARDPNGWFHTILESDTFRDESTGLAFSPDGKRMYVSFQSTGKIYDIWREDGLPFHGQTLNVRYH